MNAQHHIDTAVDYLARGDEDFCKRGGIRDGEHHLFQAAEAHSATASAMIAMNFDAQKALIVTWREQGDQFHASGNLEYALAIRDAADDLEKLLKKVI